MALINNNYVLVTEESVDNSAETTSHPTEDGLPISDTVRMQPISVSLSGKIVDVDDKTKAETIIKNLKTLQKEGSLISYVGQVGAINNLQIQEFNTNHNHRNHGGADFSMTLKEVRIAKKAYSKTQTPVTSTSSSVKIGDRCLFLGGNVYYASDAAKPTTRKGQSVCMLTKISSLEGATHIYHLISVDKEYPNKVYGWVDKNRVRAISDNTNKGSSNGGTQQIQ